MKEMKGCRKDVWNTITRSFRRLGLKHKFLSLHARYRACYGWFKWRMNKGEKVGKERRKLARVSAENFPFSSFGFLVIVYVALLEACSLRSDIFHPNASSTLHIAQFLPLAQLF